MTARDRLASVLREAAEHAVEAGLPVLTFEGYADAVIAAGWRPPQRIVTDPGELAELAEGSVVLDALGVVRMLTDGKWIAQGGGDSVLSPAMSLPAGILHEQD